MAARRFDEVKLARESGFDDLSFATRSYRPEYASHPDLQGQYKGKNLIVWKKFLVLH